MVTEKDPKESRISRILMTVEELKAQLGDFERMREETRAAIESAVKLIPSLEDERSRLQEGLEETKGKITHANSLIRNLEQEERKATEMVSMEVCKQDDVNEQGGHSPALHRDQG